MEEDDKYTRITLRIPKYLDKKLGDSASKSSKSKNAEIIARLESTFKPVKFNEESYELLGRMVEKLDVILSRENKKDDK